MLSRFRRTSTVIVMLLAFGGIVGCGSDDEQADTTKRSSESAGESTRAFEKLLAKPAGLPDWPKLDKPPAEGKQIYFLDNGVEGIIENGITDATEALGWDYHSVAYNPANPATANSAYVTAINEGADVVISTGLARAQVEEGLAAAKGKDVHVVHMFSLDSPRDPDFAQVANLKANTGAWSDAAAKGIIANAGADRAEARIGIVTSSGLPFIQVNAESVQKAIARLCPECSAEFIDVPADEFTSGRTPAAVVSFLQRNPETEYVHMVLGDFAGALEPALDSAGFESVKLSGLAPLPAQNAALAEDDGLFWVQVPDEYMGWLVMDSAVRRFTGGEASLHNDETMPVWVVNKDNLDFNPKRLPDFPDGYREAFKALWGVGGHNG